MEGEKKGVGHYLGKVARAVLIIVSALIFIFLLLASTEESSTEATEQAPDWVFENGIWKCNRTTPKETDPDFRRALQLLYDRANDGKKSPDNRNVAMCVDIVASDSTVGQASAVFLTDENTTRDNLTIYVAPEYKEQNVLVTAMLLKHEITHVYQALIESETKQGMDCIDSEIQAFMAERVFFYDFLNAEERTLLLNKAINLKNGRFRPESDRVAETYQNIYMVANKFTNAMKKCSNYDKSAPEFWNCTDNDMMYAIRQDLVQDPYYINQCKL